MAEGREGGAGRAGARLLAVRLVSAADVAAGTYGISDVVLPLPGSRILYPAHSTAEVGSHPAHLAPIQPSSWRVPAALSGLRAALDTCRSAVRPTGLALRWNQRAIAAPVPSIGELPWSRRVKATLTAACKTGF